MRAMVDGSDAIGAPGKGPRSVQQGFALIMREHVDKVRVYTREGGGRTRRKCPFVGLLACWMTHSKESFNA